MALSTGVVVPDLSTTPRIVDVVPGRACWERNATRMRAKTFMTCNDETHYGGIQLSGRLTRRGETDHFVPRAGSARFVIQPARKPTDLKGRNACLTSPTISRAKWSGFARKTNA